MDNKLPAVLPIPDHLEDLGQNLLSISLVVLHLIKKQRKMN